MLIDIAVPFPTKLCAIKSLCFLTFAARTDFLKVFKKVFILPVPMENKKTNWRCYSHRLSRDKMATLGFGQKALVVDPWLVLLTKVTVFRS
jgi:hypothetical protein